MGWCGLWLWLCMVEAAVAVAAAMAQGWWWLMSCWCGVAWHDMTWGGMPLGWHVA